MIQPRTGRELFTQRFPTPPPSSGSGCSGPAGLHTPGATPGWRFAPLPGLAGQPKTVHHTAFGAEQFGEQRFSRDLDVLPLAGGHHQLARPPSRSSWPPFDRSPFGGLPAVPPARATAARSSHDGPAPAARGDGRAGPRGRRRATAEVRRQRPSPAPLFVPPAGRTTGPPDSGSFRWEWVPRVPGGVPSAGGRPAGTVRRPSAAGPREVSHHRRSPPRSCNAVGASSATLAVQPL